MSEVKINPIPSYSVETDDAGVLNQLVRQPYDNSPSQDSSGLHYSEKWKGRYDTLKEILSILEPGLTISQTRTKLNSVQGLHVTEQITHPTQPITRDGNTMIFKLESFRVEESDFGDHGFLYLDYLASFDSSSSPEQPYTEDEWQDTWSVSWQSYSVDPYAFCSNKAGDCAPCSPSFDSDPETAKPEPDYSYAARRHIEQYLNSMPESRKVSDRELFYFAPNRTEPSWRFFLNDAEACVLKKKMLGRSATYHYPIVVHQTVMSGDITSFNSYPKTIGQGIDYPVTGMSGMPYTFDDKWTFLKIGDDMTQTKNKKTKMMTITRRETFMGMTSYDKNFYGDGAFSHDKNGLENGRWPIGGI